MAIIYSYPKVTSPLATDVLVLTDTTLTAGKRKNKTKSLAMSDLASYVVSSTSGITGSGTINTIPIFTGSTTIGDSFMTYDPASLFFNISKRLSIDGDLSVSGRGEFSGGYIRISCPLQDGSNLSGTAGQVLSSTGNNVQWVDAASGTVTSISLTMPSAFSVAGSAITSSGTLSVTGAGSTSQVILGDGTLGSIPGGPYLPLAGGTMTGDILHGDNVKSTYGTTPFLEIYSDGTSSFIKETSAAGGNNLSIQGTVGVAISGGGTSLFTGGGGNNTSIFDTGGVSRLELTTSDAIFPAGNVGIGTTAPADKLHVQGTVRAVVQAANGFAFTAINSSGSSASGIRFDNNNGNLILKNSSNVETIKIRSGFGDTFFDGGNVGIGTTSPASKLEVDGGDIEVDDSASGLILRSPDGTRYRVTVANGGTLSVAAV